MLNFIVLSTTHHFHSHLNRISIQTKKLLNWNQFQERIFHQIYQFQARIFQQILLVSTRIPDTYLELPTDSNLHSINHIPTNENHDNLRIINLNCRSIRSLAKRTNLAVLINEYNADIIIGSESHLDQSFLSSEILPSNYTIFRKDRTLGGGGVFIGIKNYLTAIPYHTTSSNAEILWIKLITSKNHPTYVCSFYIVSQPRPFS